jgi:predicted O-methyltransferase YrrM
VNPLAYLRDNLAKLGWWAGNPAITRFHLNRALWEAGCPWTKLRPVPLGSIIPAADRLAGALALEQPQARRRGTSLELDELVVLLSIVRATGARRVVEVGTFNGHTALNVAANLPADGTVVTIDLPPEGSPRGPAGTALPTDYGARVYDGHPAAARIRQVLADSATLDWQSLGGPFDLAIIDGDHSSPMVASDTRGVLSVLAPGGIVLWHDYEWRTVARVVDRAVAAGEQIAWVAGTRFAIGIFPDPARSAGLFTA